MTVHLDEEVRNQREHQAEQQCIQFKEQTQLEQQLSTQCLQAQQADIMQQQALQALQREHDKQVTTQHSDS